MEYNETMDSWIFDGGMFCTGRSEKCIDIDRNEVKAPLAPVKEILFLY